MYETKGPQTKIQCGSPQATLQSTDAPALRSLGASAGALLETGARGKLTTGIHHLKVWKAARCQVCIEELFHLRTLGAKIETTCWSWCQPPKQTTKFVANSMSSQFPLHTHSATCQKCVSASSLVQRGTLHQTNHDA